ncbi:hypothetical protein [Roseovarius sp. PS-C2]|uniref:hypothetical protein n=1 Tax=Roseovarius sp. PS-C2 TaxID=2820814 RepID=UPI001C0C8F90|nr:hypothetical protein [Roseovarius sp. PS-C2]
MIVFISGSFRSGPGFRHSGRKTCAKPVKPVICGLIRAEFAIPINVFIGRGREFRLLRKTGSGKMHEKTALYTAVAGTPLCQRLNLALSKPINWIYQPQRFQGSIEGRKLRGPWPATRPSGRALTDGAPQ